MDRCKNKDAGKITDKIFQNAAFSLLFGVFTIFMLSSTGFIFHLPISPLYTVFGLVLALIVFAARLYLAKMSPLKIALCLLLLFLVIIGLTCVSALFMDPSYDGRAYHQTTVLLLEKGWNPIYDNVYAFCSSRFGYTPYELIWSENYVKFSEIFAANIMALTGKIETGKVFNGISALIAFLYVFYVLSKPKFSQNKVFTLKMRVLFAFLLVYNPIVLAQFFTFYIDGLLYLYFLISVLALIDWKIRLETEEKPIIAMFFFVMASAIMLNIKLGGFLCFISILLCAGLFLAVQKFWPNFQAALFKTKRFWYSVLVIFLLALISGINPYFTNISKGKHPLHPLFGKEKINIMTPNTPKAFDNKPLEYKVFMSLFSKMDNFTTETGKKPELKIPFSVYKSELAHLDSTDAKISGFGIFFSGIFLMALALFFLINYKTLNAKKEFAIILTTLGFATVLNPESWWARYIPQLWAIVVFAGLMAYLNPLLENTPKKRCFKYFIGFFLLFLFANSFLINAASTLWARKYTVKTTKFIQSAKARQEKSGGIIIQKIPEIPGAEPSYYRKLDEAGVKYDIKR